MARASAYTARRKAVGRGPAYVSRRFPAVGRSQARCIATVLTVSFLVFAAKGFAAPNALRSLRASVGPGKAISINAESGQKVVRLQAGRYTIVVSDRSRRDNFHLVDLDPTTADKKTGLAFVGTRRWTVTLSKGVYRYRSDARRFELRGSFRVF